MVDATSSLAFYYNHSQSLKAQLTPNSESISYQDQTQEALVGQDANGNRFGAAVDVNISVSITQGTASTGTAAADESPGQQALDKIKQGNDQAKAFPKKLAVQQLDQAVKELSFLKLLGSGKKAATEAARIAKEIATAVKNYSSAGSGDTAAAETSTETTVTESSASAVSASGAAAPGTAAASTAPAGTAAATPGDTAAAAGTTNGSAAAGTQTGSTTESTTTTQTTTTTQSVAALGTAAGGSGAATGTGAASGAQSSDDTLFYNIATAALGEINKFLKKNLISLETSPDQKTREAGKKAKEEFDKAQQALTEAQSPQAGGSAATGTTVTESVTVTISTFAQTADAGAAASAVPVAVPAAPVSLVA
ncbi:MAG TPA: hypothetical protein VM689_11875 [Aliidongia sp.]|nr:hypothetical protein [Aliidongia sp.]